MQPVLGVAVCSLLNQMFAEVGHFYHFHVNINKLRKRTLNFGLIANPFYFVVLELLGGIRKAAAVAFLWIWQARIGLGCSQQFAADQVPDRTLGQASDAGGLTIL
jgi:hypothetical protein